MEGDGFVTTEGTAFVLDGSRYSLVGVNAYRLAYSRWDAAIVDEICRRCAAMGLTTIRTWAFGAGEPDLFEPEPGVYNETAFERLDYVVATAAEHDLRLVLALTNYWADFGGMDAYVAWSPTATRRDEFYTDPDTTGRYRAFVEQLLTRTNTHTGVEYREDPTICLWELANEPRCPGRDGAALVRWIDETAEFLKSLDGNHPVSTGLEGLVANASRYGDAGEWMGRQEADFVAVHGSEHVDAASFHLYPDHWDLSFASSLDFVRDRVREATSLGKPAYLGEFGLLGDSAAARSAGGRAAAYTRWYDVLAEVDAAGALVWELLAEADASGDGFSLRPGADGEVLDAVATGAKRL